MDIVTQGLAGAILAQSVASPKETRIAMIIGFLAGLFADIDTLFTQSAVDPLLQLEFHRHFTHALLFIPLGGLIAALLFWPFFRNHLTFKRLLLFTTVAFATSGLLDACTSYGTQLLLPFSNERIAWNVISILDPIFSFSLILALVYTALKHQPKFAIWGICFALSYLTLGYIQHQRAATMIASIAQSRGHHIERFEVKPTMGNLLLWRSIYEFEGFFYIDGLRLAFLGEQHHYKGTSIKRFATTDLPRIKEGSVLAQDIQRFAFFSSHYLSLFEKDQLVLGDVRYSMLPNSAQPIWGITLDLNKQQQHTPFEQYHDASPEVRNTFITMLLGRRME